MGLCDAIIYLKTIQIELLTIEIGEGGVFGVGARSEIDQFQRGRLQVDENVLVLSKPNTQAQKKKPNNY